MLVNMYEIVCWYFHQHSSPKNTCILIFVFTNIQKILHQHHNTVETSICSRKNNSSEQVFRKITPMVHCCKLLKCCVNLRISQLKNIQLESEFKGLFRSPGYLLRIYLLVAGHIYIDYYLLKHPFHSQQTIDLSKMSGPFENRDPRRCAV